MTRAIVILVVYFLTSGLGADSASAVIPCGSAFGLSHICADQRFRNENAPEGESPGSGARSPTIIYDRQEFGAFPCFGPPEGPFEYDLNILSDRREREEAGVQVALIPRNRAGDLVGAPIVTCSLAANGGAPPAAPSLDEIRAAAVELIPQPTVELNPRARGLVGFEVWLWSEVPTAPVSASVEVRGWTATVTATPTNYRWTTSTGEDLSSPVPGSEAQPAATFAYQHSGDHTVTHSVVWSGTYTLTGYGVTVSDADLGTVEPAASLVQDVVSVEAVGTG